MRLAGGSCPKMSAERGQGPGLRVHVALPDPTARKGNSGSLPLLSTSLIGRTLPPPPSLGWLEDEERLKYSNVMVNFMAQFAWAEGGPGNW